MKYVVIVESPAKAKTIHNYLGNDYTIVASFGHVRDLPSKNGSVLPDQDFSMTWEVDARGQKQIQDIAKAVKSADALYLATDPDREGEAISWHIEQVLREKGLLKNIPVHRIVFYEITKSAIKEAITAPRPIDQSLVDAYLARRALDYLVGFNLSPILWRKLPGSRSAGRVQSVALRLVVDREREIEAFKSQEFWTVEGKFVTPQNSVFLARLTHLSGKKLEKFDLPTEETAQKACQAIKEQTYTIKDVEKRQVNRQPPPPFITSTLQQEASRKLGFSASNTMRVAQRLYEGISTGSETTGLITYMRTDSPHMAEEAIKNARSHIQTAYGKLYLPETSRIFKSKVKNAQEAHEAIRPTDFSRTPQSVKPFLDDMQYKLYDLIWKRAIASQMANALFDQVGVDVVSLDRKIILRATGSTLVFDGFLKLYQEGRDEGDDAEKENLLPRLQKGEALDLNDIIPDQHFTQPPPRYTEASLVKKLEELGIGRPSTYASILSVLQDRSYVYLEKKQFFPENRGRIVTAFLVDYFKRYVEYDFTAGLEEQLDEISAGEQNWKKVMRLFWDPFIETVQQTEKLRQSEILTKLQENLESFLFPDSTPESRKCPQCQEGDVHLKLSKFGAFLGCTRYPDCTYRRSLADKGTDKETSFVEFEPTALGKDPETDQEITVRKGPYGFYLQWDGTDQNTPEEKPKKGKKKTDKPKRIPIPSMIEPTSMTIEQALMLKSLPKPIGIHPTTGDAISVGIGRFGPYVKYGAAFVSIPKKFDFLELTLEEALDLIEKKAQRPARPRRASLRNKTKGKKSGASDRS